MSALLEVAGLDQSFGGLQALEGVSFSVQPGEIFGPIGPNGSGKTTTINLLTGRYTASGGRFVIGDRELRGCKPEEIVRAGVPVPSRTCVCSPCTACSTTYVPARPSIAVPCGPASAPSPRENNACCTAPRAAWSWDA